MDKITQARISRKDGPKPAVPQHQLTDEQREVLPRAWAYLLLRYGGGRGVDASFRMLAFAGQWCWAVHSEADDSSDQDAGAYRRFRNDRALRPWARAERGERADSAARTERDVVYAVLTFMERWDGKNLWTRRSIASLAKQAECSYRTVQRTLDRIENSAFPPFAITRQSRASIFTFVPDPLAFAAARDRARAARDAAQKPERTKVQVDEALGRITPAESRRKQRALRHKRGAPPADGPPAVSLVEPGSLSLSTRPARRARAPQAQDADVDFQTRLRKLWLRELCSEYPAQRVTQGERTARAFHDQFAGDPRPASQVWAEMRNNLESQKAGYEWRVKGMVPSLEKWLSEGRWRQQHSPEPPVSERFSRATLMTLHAASAILNAPDDKPH